MPASSKISLNRSVLALALLATGVLITNMTADVDYEAIRQSLPAGVVPAYDGLQLETHQ